MLNIQLTRSLRRVASLAGCSVASGILCFASTPAFGCNSGNLNTAARLDSAVCQARTNSQFATAVGLAAVATNLGTAIGQGAKATMNHTTALGGQSGPSSNRPNFDGSTSVGYQAGFDGAGAFSVALGGGSGFSPIDLLGSAAHARGDYSIAIGGGKDDFPGARANGLRSIAIGQKSVSGADFGIGVGFNTTTAFAGTAIGTDARATGDSSTAVGRLSSATGLSSVAFGASATASGQRSVAIGAFSGTTGSGSSNIALGYNAGGNVLGSGNIAIGLNAGRDVTASSSISIGWGSRATASSSVAIGLNSVASASNTVSVGRETSLRRIVNVATGVNPNDAVNVAQLQAALAAAAVPPPAPALVNTRDDTAVITMRRELDRLQSLVASLQQRLAALESKSALARAEAPP